MKSEPTVDIMSNSTVATASNLTLPDADKNTFVIRCVRPFNQGEKTRLINMSPTFIFFARIIAGINFSAIIPTVAANLSVAIVIVKTKQAHLASNMILLSIVFVNLIEGVFSFPSLGNVVLSVTYRKYDCISSAISGYIGGSLALVSMLTVIFLAYERYTAVVQTYRYVDKFTPERIKMTTIAIWVFPFIWFFLLMFFPPIMTFAIIVVSLITVTAYVFNVIAYIKIHRTINRMWQRDASNTIDRAKNTEHELSKEGRRNKFTAYAIFFLLACYLPSFIKQMFMSVMKDPTLLNYSCDTIMCLHATFSPWLYSWQSPAIGRGVKKLLRLRKNNEVSGTDGSDFQVLARNKDKNTPTHADVTQNFHDVTTVMN